MERINSPFSPALLNMATGPFDMYHIHPSTSPLAFVNAPITTLKFFYQPEATEFAKAYPDFFQAIERKAGCVDLKMRSENEESCSIECGSKASIYTPDR
jgi:hypothetical protein